MFGVVITAYTIAVIYNLLLFSVLYTNKISSTFHEQATEKKEVEYSLGINKIWNLQMFYTFSSFTSTKSKMYHRIYFNLYILVIILFQSLFRDESTKCSWHTALVISWLVFSMFVRPYRCASSNFLYAITQCAVVMQVIFISMKVAKFEQSIFVDKHFFELTTILNSFIWFLIFTAVLMIYLIRIKWPVNKDQILQVTEG